MPDDRVVAKHRVARLREVVDREGKQGRDDHTDDDQEDGHVWEMACAKVNSPPGS
jgi:hypothetical protein